VMREPLLLPEGGALPCPCGALLDEGSRFCSKCGHSVDEAVAALAAAAVEARAKEKAEILTCPACSAEVARGTVFCVHCGAPLDRPGW